MSPVYIDRDAGASDNVEMAEPRSFAHRVFIEDVRSDGKYLRVTWHAELPGFIVSNWNDDVCVGATRVAVEDAPQLIHLLANGLAASLDEERTRTRAAVRPRSRASRLRERAAQLGQQVESRMPSALRDRWSTKHGSMAKVVELSRHRAAGDEPRWMSPPQ